jgi:hypothetical protein
VVWEAEEAGHFEGRSGVEEGKRVPEGLRWALVRGARMEEVSSARSRRG